MKAVRTSVITGITAALFISNCSNSPLSTHDVQDDGSTLSARAMGNTAFASLDESSLAIEMLAMDNQTPENILTLPALPQAAATTPAALVKKTGGAAFSIDTIDGKLRLTTSVSGSNFEKSDTVEVLLDETVYDGIDGNESITSLRGTTVFSGGTTDRYTAEDMDGDNIINRGSDSPRARLTLTSERNTVTTRTIFEADAGSDGTFDTQSDNLLLKASWVKLSADGDTLASAQFTDADGDGIIGGAKPQSIGVRLYDAEKPLHPLVEYSKADFTIEQPADGAERLSSFSAEKKFITGRISTAKVTTESGEETFEAGEHVRITVATAAPAASDSEATAQLVCTIDPGYSIGDESDSKLLSLTLKKEYLYGLRSTSEFTCTFDPPVPAGSDPQGGDFSLTVNYKNGKTATLEGTFTEDSISAEHTNGNGEKTEVTLSREN